MIINCGFANRLNKSALESARNHLIKPSGIFNKGTRSQLENKKLCLARLEAKIMVWKTEQLTAQQQSQWQEHNALERGNPVKTIRAVI